MVSIFKRFICFPSETRLSRVANTHLLKKHCYSRSIAFLYGWNLCAQVCVVRNLDFLKQSLLIFAFSTLLTVNYVS